MVQDGTHIGQAYDLLLKAILIGESGVGKSCLLHHFMHAEHKDNATQTIGVEFASRIVRVGDKSVKLQLWDTAGQERFRSVTRSYYRGAGACVLVFDVTRRESFTPLAQWLADARALASPDLVVVIVGNKLDRAHERQVSHDEALQWAIEHNAHYIESSSLNGQNVQLPFTFACKEVVSAVAAGRMNPETAGSGISYGDRGLRSVASTAGGAAGTAGKGFSFAELMPNGSTGGTVSLQNVKQRFNGCC